MILAANSFCIWYLSMFLIQIPSNDKLNQTLFNCDTRTESSASHQKNINKKIHTADLMRVYKMNEPYFRQTLCTGSEYPTFCMM